MRALLFLALLPALPLTGCVSGSAAHGGSGSSSNVIAEAELADFPGVTVYDAVSRLRSHWLRGRSGTFQNESGRNYPRVFIDGRPWGEIDTLQQIDLSQVSSIRFISASDATTRFGTGYPAGIIEVVTKR